MMGWLVLGCVALLVGFAMKVRYDAGAEWERTEKPKCKVAVQRMLQTSTEPKTCVQINTLLEQYTTLDSISDAFLHGILDEMLKDGVIVRVSVEPNRYHLPPKP